MTVDDQPGSANICTRGRSSLSADDSGLTVRNFPGRPRLLLWSEISRFADGRYNAGEGPAHWVLDVVLPSWQTRSAGCTHAESAAPETLAAIRQVAERYGIPANLTGIMMASDGRPDREGLYEDPWGQAGARHWDGKQWSPLLPTDHGTSMSVWKSTALWTELPVAQGSWAYPAAQVRLFKIWAGVHAALTVGLLAAGLTTGKSWLAISAALPAFFVLVARMALRQSKQLQKAASAPLGRLN